MPAVMKQTAVERLQPPQADGWPDDEGVKVLLYGASGTGKTTFASTFPDPIEWLICSSVNNPGELRSVDTPENRKRIRPRRISSVSQISAILNRFEGPRTIVLDHASGLQDLTLKEILGIDELPAQKGWGLANQQQYGQSSLQCKEVLRALLGMSCNVVIISQERRFGDEDGNSEIIKPTIGPAVSPSVAGWLCPACDYILQAFKRPMIETKNITIAGNTKEIKSRGHGVEYVARCEPHDVFMTKFRVPKGRKLPDVIVDPTYTKMMQIIRGG